MIRLAEEAPFRLGRAQVAPATRQVAADGRSWTLEPRVMQVLVALAKAEGGVVGRDELIELCWGGRIVGENALNRVISVLRRLSEALEGAFAVETITKVGYRLSTDREATEAVASAPVGVGSPQTGFVLREGARGRAPRRAVLAGGAAALAAGAAGAAWVMRPSTPPAARQLLALGRQSLEAARLDQDTQAVAYLRRAVELAPRSAEAWGALSLALLTQVGRRGDDGAEADRAWVRSAARRALQLRQDDVDAQVALLLAEPVYRHWTERERGMGPLLRRHPTHKTLAAAYAQLLVQVGRWRTALAVLERLASAPLNASQQIQRAAILWGAGRLPEADQAFADAVRLWPAHLWAWTARFNFLSLNGRVEEALAMTREDVAPSGVQAIPIALAVASARALESPTPGNVAAARAGLLSARRRHEMAAVQAVIYLAALGAVEDAFAVLEPYLFPTTLPAGLERETFMLFGTATRSLRRDGRFPLLTRRLGLDAYWRDAGAGPEIAP